jgi:ATP-dependent DNA helicase RecG
MAKRLGKLSIYTVKDLLYFFPYRYRNYSLTVPISSVQEGETVTVEGKIETLSTTYTRSRKSIQRGKLSDQSGSLNVVWFNQPYLKEALVGKSKLRLSGKVRRYQNELSLVSPDYEIPQAKGNPRYRSLHTGRLVPLYHSSPLVSSKYLRKVIATALVEVKEKIPEFLPIKILIKNRLIPEKEAIEKIHFPENKAAAEAAKKRLSFDEMFFIQLKAIGKKLSWQQQKGAAKITLTPKQVKDFTRQLPFQPTKAQKRVIGEIGQDLEKNQPMNRLLQGDVGSGKTVIAAFATYACFINRKTAVVMAPTQILAFQHYQTFQKLLSPWKIRVKLVSGGDKKRKSNQGYDLLVGTHALLHRPENFRNCGVVIIDEQHRFGVAQRSKLLGKAGGKSFRPHLLTMTATPIPRTITLTLYGDLDLSFLDEMPPGRKKISTFVVPAGKRKKAYQWIKKEIRQKKVQSFIVCPFIEESETLSSVKAARVEFEKLQKKVFSDLRLDLLHGRMKTKEKEAILKKMQKGKIDILVSTPVVEVGIDIPNATIMVIEGAERFGLAQLHQLRGRIGRGPEKSYCFLFAETKSSKAIKRLKALESVDSGLKLAEIDLKMRGPGEVYGLRQHGFPKLKIASYSDLETVTRARQAAEEIISRDPELEDHPQIKKILWPEEELIAPN